MQNSKSPVGTTDDKSTKDDGEIRLPNLNKTNVSGSTYSKSFFEDLFSPLDEVQRVWLRRIGVILLTPLIFASGLFIGGLEMLYKWYKCCW